ncbi:hypothetical protein TIFTF001_047026 [Ficus carica]|uniref:Secreted protein n=1 Tax=Ficus carica TaxID=3494 RepID=A0AA87YVM2_FICCA|nr:hypothetical protein TIFTF001_047026 [Ficus carica]
MLLVAAKCCWLLLSAGIASRSAATLSVGGCSVRWWRLQWAMTLGDGEWGLRRRPSSRDVASFAWSLTMVGGEQE